MTNETTTTTSDFLRLFARAAYSFDKSWVGARVDLESNEQQEIATENFTPLSQRFKAYTGFFGVGDSLKIHAEIGYTYRNFSPESNLDGLNKSELNYFYTSFSTNINNIYKNFK